MKPEGQTKERVKLKGLTKGFSTSVCFACLKSSAQLACSSLNSPACSRYGDTCPCTWMKVLLCCCDASFSMTVKYSLAAAPAQLC